MGTYRGGHSAIRAYSRRDKESIVESTRYGSATLSGGTVVVADTSITSNSVINLMPVGITNAGFLGVTLNAGVGFTISSSGGSDARVVKYSITESA
jgi:hypothetical protein